MADGAEERLYSRQLYVLGGGARRLAGAAVLVSGLRGTGAQVAAALVLAGTGRVVLHDRGEASVADRGQQFLLRESDIGQNRAEASRRALAELNPCVTVVAYTGELSEPFLTSFQQSPSAAQARVVVLTESPLEEQIRVGNFCHAQGICFIVADAKGLAGQLFCDFGEHFIVNDPAEGEPVCAAVKHISKGNPGIVTCTGMEGSRGHLFSDGDLVTFSGVEGMTELNGQEPVPVQVMDAFRLKIGDTRSFSCYCCGGLVSQVRLPQVHSYKPLSQALAEPKIQAANPEELPRSRSLHAAFQALHAFREEQGRLPRPRAPEDAKRVLELAWSLATQPGPLDEDIVRAFASVSAGDLCPVAAVVGAAAAQEALKVGAGAVGCELLKNFAMMGLAAGPEGDLTVTDMDTVALSNLHRQLLYRSADVSKPKSVVAAAAVRRMNPDVRVTAHQNQVGPATEMLYGDDFFRHLDGVASALDTLEARAYLESCCFRYLTPLLDSGTEGPRGNVLAMVPHLTKLLGPAAAPEDDTFPICTLRYFPHTIQHTLQWARDEFEGLFQLPAEHVNRFMEDPAFPEQLPTGKAVEVLEQVRRSLQERPRDWQDCVRWARRHWQSCYHDAIAQLLHTFPPEHEVRPGVPFWAWDRTCPHPLIFNPENDTHLDYIMAAAHLFAQSHKIPPCSERASAQAVLCSVVLPPFVPQEGFQIHLSEEQEEVLADDERLEELTQDLGQQRQELIGGGEAQVPLMEPIHFEKDNDIHIDFITAASNLRAESYSIPAASRLMSKRITGRIVPAIITSTAAVAGLACLEVYKLAWGCRDLSCYRNSNFSLSDCLLLRFQPPPSSVYWYRGREWSCWDRLEMRAVSADGEEMTVQNILDWMQRTHGWTVTMLLHGFTVLYDSGENEGVRALMQKQRLSATLENAGEPQQRVLKLEYVCEEEDAETEATRPPLMCFLP
ncbi:ubiquitin-like modifier-activating enzyme 7 isoform X2 [Neopsephotus bourkii]|uniref:ubiquitin-like modifier-activating enzyme 7 isoform X2 n=1 Tax=Neopsephotus bourkii TaxID=309878 RepID=UPI002AA55D3E|nr:ubiquitin-like modifier-activating enzyme 7 isoform X2 [Neopsephotus bourkii]